VVVFIDSSAIYAYLARDDQNHTRSLATFKDLVTQGVDLLTTNYVLLETTALVQKRLGLDAVRTFQREFAPMVRRVDWVSEHDHLGAMEALLLAGRRKLSLVDCVSFQYMRKFGLTTAFTFDDHFREQGFTVVPEPAG